MIINDDKINILHNDIKQLECLKQQLDHITNEDHSNCHKKCFIDHDMFLPEFFESEEHINFLKERELLRNKVVIIKNKYYSISKDVSLEKLEFTLKMLDLLKIS